MVVCEEIAVFWMESQVKALEVGYPPFLSTLT